MNLVLHLPDAIATRLQADGADLERRALEALVIQEFRAGRINKDELGEALGLDNLDEVDGFLKAYGVFEPYTIHELEREVEALGRLGF